MRENNYWYTEGFRDAVVNNGEAAHEPTDQRSADAYLDGFGAGIEHHNLQIMAREMRDDAYALH